MRVAALLLWAATGKSPSSDDIRMPMSMVSLRGTGSFTVDTFAPDAAKGVEMVPAATPDGFAPAPVMASPGGAAPVVPDGYAPAVADAPMPAGFTTAQTPPHTAPPAPVVPSPVAMPPGYAPAPQTPEGAAEPVVPPGFATASAPTTAGQAEPVVPPGYATASAPGVASQAEPAGLQGFATAAATATPGAAVVPQHMALPPLPAGYDAAPTVDERELRATVSTAASTGRTPAHHAAAAQRVALRAPQVGGATAASTDGAGAPDSTVPEGFSEAPTGDVSQLAGTPAGSAVAGESSDDKAYSSASRATMQDEGQAAVSPQAELVPEQKAQMREDRAQMVGSATAEMKDEAHAVMDDGDSAASMAPETDRADVDDSQAETEETHAASAEMASASSAADLAATDTSQAEAEDSRAAYRDEDKAYMDHGVAAREETQQSNDESAEVEGEAHQEEDNAADDEEQAEAPQKKTHKHELAIGKLLVNGPLPSNFDKLFVKSCATAVGSGAKAIKVLSVRKYHPEFLQRNAVAGQSVAIDAGGDEDDDDDDDDDEKPADKRPVKAPKVKHQLMEVKFSGPKSAVDAVLAQAADPDSKLATGKLMPFLTADDDDTPTPPKSNAHQAHHTAKHAERTQAHHKAAHTTRHAAEAHPARHAERHLKKKQFHHAMRAHVHHTEEKPARKNVIHARREVTKPAQRHAAPKAPARPPASKQAKAPAAPAAKAGARKETKPAVATPVDAAVARAMKVVAPPVKAAPAALHGKSVKAAGAAASQGTSGMVAGAAAARAKSVKAGKSKGSLHPFGHKITKNEDEEETAEDASELADEMQAAQVAEEKRVVHNALQKMKQAGGSPDVVKEEKAEVHQALGELRGAAIASFDAIEQEQEDQLDKYAAQHTWRKKHLVQAGETPTTAPAAVAASSSGQGDDDGDESGEDDDSDF
mmetsp:Transcript_35189/g.92185  ORF Transcript_35189/g.92185 Transcript_35189/m.92185 type:complete len:933 (-) Transcript_35189:74-2872(-)